MTRSSFVVMGLCFAVCACGSKFTADGASGASGLAGQGGSLAGGGGSGGSGGKAGSGGDAGATSDAGADSGGAAGSSGATDLGGAGGGGHGGASAGTGGGGGAVVEPSIPALGLALWLRADRGVQKINGQVQQWLDQSGNQMNAGQTATNVRPQYLATGLNGLPTLEFDGKGAFLKLPDGFGDFSHGLAGFVVARPTAAECSSMVEFSNGKEIQDIAFGMAQGLWQYEVEVPYIQTGSVDTSGVSLYAVNHRAVGTVDLRVNGSLLGTKQFAVPAVPASKVRQNNFIGHTLYDCNYFQGQISEIIVYTRHVTDNELVAIEGYLQKHWALPTTAATP